MLEIAACRRPLPETGHNLAIMRYQKRRESWDMWAMTSKRWQAMRVFGCGVWLAVGALVLGLAGQAAAQENLDYGKTPAQLFASDCAICHKTPQGLAAKGGGLLGLESFLREHYTASRESAAAIAGYLRSVGSGPATPPGRGAKRPPKGDDKAKKDEKTGEKAGEKPDEKAGEKKTEKKPAEKKPAEAKGAAGGKGGAEGKGSDAKADDAKPADAKPADAKPADAKPAEAKPAEPKKPAEGGKPD